MLDIKGNSSIVKYCSKKHKHELIIRINVLNVKGRTPVQDSLVLKRVKGSKWYKAGSKEGGGGVKGKGRSDQMEVIHASGKRE